MSSGLTASTSPNSTCAAWLARGYTQDPLGLRQSWGSDSNGCDRLVGGSFATLKVLQLWFAKVFFLLLKHTHTHVFAQLPNRPLEKSSLRRPQGPATSFVEL
jgi:hypothetical protein